MSMVVIALGNCACGMAWVLAVMTPCRPRIAFVCFTFNTTFHCEDSEVAYFFPGHTKEQICTKKCSSYFCPDTVSVQVRSRLVHPTASLGLWTRHVQQICFRNKVESNVASGRWREPIIQSRSCHIATLITVVVKSQSCLGSEVAPCISDTSHIGGAASGNGPWMLPPSTRPDSGGVQRSTIYCLK